MINLMGMVSKSLPMDLIMKETMLKVKSRAMDTTSAPQESMKEDSRGRTSMAQVLSAILITESTKGSGITD